MADTGAPFNLRYQTLADAPDGAGLGQNLATDVAGWLSRAYPVNDAAARISLSSPPEGRIVYQRDDDSLWVWTNDSTWVSAGSGSGGGGGGSSGAIPGQWQASSNQSLTNNTDTVLAFGTTGTVSAAVTRATSGVGHKFTLANTAAYAVSSTVRFAAGSAGPRFIELRNSAQTVRYAGASSGQDGGPNAVTLGFGIVQVFTAGTELVVIAAQNSGGSLSTQYQGTSIVDGFVRLNITQLG